ncbi:MAG: response regulator [Deltaproteobacteria bacterium]
MAGSRPGVMMPMNDNKLLVVDDDIDTCANLSDILTEFGYDVDVAYRGNDALDLLKQHPYRMALLDYRLPCMTGVELFRQMRQIRGDISGLLVTGYASPETTEAALAAGLRQVLSKPVDVPILVPLIEDGVA